MNYELPPEYTALRRMIREFCIEEIATLAKKIDDTGVVERGLLQRMGDVGMFGVPFPREYGGMGAGELGYCILMEELDRYCASVATIVGAHIGIGVMSLYLDGSKALKEKYMPDLCSGKKICAFALTESNAGSDAAAIQLRATLEGDRISSTGEDVDHQRPIDVINVLPSPTRRWARAAAQPASPSKAGGVSAPAGAQDGLARLAHLTAHFDEVAFPKKTCWGKWATASSRS